MLVTQSRVDLLGSSENALRLISRGSLRRSPVTPSSLDILLLLASEADGPELQWLPFTEFGYYPLGTEFCGQETRFPTDSLSKFDRLEAQEDFMVPDNVPPSLEIDLPSEIENQLSGSRHRMTLDRSRNPPLVIANTEIARFYLSAISLLASDLLRLDIEPEKAFKRVCDPTATKWPEEGVLQIEPRHGFMSRPAAVQLGLLSASDDITDFWSDAISTLRKLHAGGRDLNFHRWFPKGTGSLEAVCRSRTIAEQGVIERVTELRELVCDRRAVKFHTLVVQLPFNTDSALLDDLNAGIDEEIEKTVPRTRSILDRLLQRSGAAPGTRSTAVAMAGRTLPRAFPALEHIAVEYVRKKGPLHPVADVLQIFKRVDTAAFGASKPKGTAAKTVCRHSSGEPRREVDFNLFIAPPTPREAIGWQIFPQSGLQPAILAFQEAASTLARRGELAAGTVSLLDAPDGFVNAAVIPSSWGRWSEGFAPGRQRRVFALPVVFEGYFFWIIELESGARSRLHGIGVVQPIGDFEPIEFLNAYLAGVRRRQLKDIAGTVASPFPKGHFPDAAVSYMKHTDHKLRPIFLASGIRNRCRRMIDERRLLSS